jgi:DNA topoisomerase VI subunit B
MKNKTNIKQLNRHTLQTDRALEFFSLKELSMQIGQDKEKWPPALLKELVDNALDECEKLGRQPHIVVEISDNSFSVADNGSGLSKATIEKSLDYKIRVSDKNYYLSPTRGQLGNALMCIYAAPFVADGYGKVEIETKRTHYTIEVSLDRIAQKPVINLSKKHSERAEGVKITVFYKNSASLLGFTKSDDFYKKTISANDLLSAYATFNPHATFTFGEKLFEAVNSQWAKWNPSNPTSAHWYTQEQLRDLVAAYLANNHDKTIREFVSEFRGLAGSQKQKLITDKVGLQGRLSDLVIHGDIDVTRIQTLLSAMQAQTQSVKPQQLGIIGKDHIVSSMERYFGVKPQTVQYKKIAGFDNNLPHVAEIAFGIKTEEHEKEGRTIVCGLNWSPTLGIPVTEFRQMLSEMRIDLHDPVCVVMHIVRPKFNFVDRGKGVVHV